MIRTRLVIGLAVTVLLTGCGGTARNDEQDRPVSFPPRPFELDVTTVDPCDGLAPSDRARLGVRTTKPGTSQDGTSNDCTWSTRDGLGYTLQTFHVGAAQAFEPGSSEIVEVAGFGAVQRSMAAPGTGLPLCQLVLDVADTASLRAQAQVTPLAETGGAYTSRSICDRLRGEASRMMANLRAAHAG